jgi:hypothetical protein
MRRILLVSALFVATALASPARADDAALAEAKARFEEGVALAMQNKHEEARLKFQQAAAVIKAPAVLFNLARSEQLTGHDYEAMDHYTQFLRAAKDATNVTDDQRAQAKKYIAELTPKVGQIDVDVPPASRVSIDGRQLEETPKEPVAVPPGRHTVEAAREGKIKSITIDCQAGAVTRVKIEYDVEPPPVVQTPASPTKWIVAGALGTLGLVGIGVGVGFGASSQGAKSDAESIRSTHPGLCAAPPLPECAQYDAKRSDAESAATNSKIGYVAGGVLLASAVATILLWPKSSEQSARIAPMIGEGTIGASIGGAL